MLPWMGGRARPHHTCPGFCRAVPGCSGMLPWMGGLARPRHTCPDFCSAMPGCSGCCRGWVIWLALVVLALVFVEQSRVVQGCCCGWVWLGLVVLALIFVE